MPQVLRLAAAALTALFMSPSVGQAGAPCSADADYGDATVTNPQVLVDLPGTVLVVSGDLNADVDALVPEMYDGVGVFAGGITPGVYVLTGENYATCGLCVRLLTEAGDDGYLAIGGTVTITQVTPDVILDVSNLALEHVVIDPGTFASSPHPDGCTSAVSSATIDTTPGGPQVPSAGPFGLVLVSGALVATGIRRLRSAAD